MSIVSTHLLHRTIEFRISYGFAVLTGVLVLTGVYAFAIQLSPNITFNQKTIEILKFFVTVSGVGGGIFSAMFVAIGLHNRFVFDAVSFSMNQVDRYGSETFIRIRQHIHTDTIYSLGPKEIIEKIQSDHEFLAAVKVMLGFFENLSISIQTKVADEDTLYRSMCYAATVTYKRLEPYVRHLRQSEALLSGSSHGDFLYSEFEKLSNAWISGQSVVNGKLIDPYRNV